MANIDIDLGKYSLGWSDPEKNVFKPEKGLNEDIIRKMSELDYEELSQLCIDICFYTDTLGKKGVETLMK